MDTYELIPVTDEIKADAATQERIDELMETLIRIICHILDYTKDQILAENDIEFSSVDDMYNEHEELNLETSCLMHMCMRWKIPSTTMVIQSMWRLFRAEQYVILIQKGMSRSNRSTIHFHLELGRMAGGLSADQRLSDRKRIETCGGN